MEDTNRIVVIVIKTIFVILIPYYWIISSNTVTGSRMETTYLISGILGYWASPGGSYSQPQVQEVFWQQNQLLYSILFIIPMLLYAFYFNKRQTDSKSIIAGFGAIFVSFISIYLTTPFYATGSFSVLFYLSVPNLISLSMFVFVFWPLLQNSLPLKEKLEESNTEEGILNQIRRILGKWFPLNIATLIWTCLAILPITLLLYVFVSSGIEANFTFTLLGGLYFLTYDYIELTSVGQYYPYRHINLSFVSVVWASYLILAIWIVNLLLGILTIRVIQGESTRRRYNRAMGIVFLVIVLPTTFITVISYLLPQHGFFTIPLPLYLIVLFLLSKFVQLPTASPEGMIKIPIRTRFASLLQRGKHAKESIETKDDDIPLDNTDKD